MTPLRTQALKGKVALITGASRGFGASVAKAMASEGAHIIALARTSGALEELDDSIQKNGGSTTLIPCDLNNIELLETLGPQLSARFPHLDILIANAGLLGTLGPVAHCKMNEWEKVFRVNVHANAQLIRTLDPLLRASQDGRALFISSRAVLAPRAYWGAYAASKSALEALVFTYAAESLNTGLKINLVDPGKMRTAMRATAYPGEDPTSLPHPDLIAEKLLQFCLPSYTQTGQRLSLQKGS